MTKKISALTSVSAAALANEIEVNEAGTSKKASLAQVKTLLGIGTTTNDNAAAGSVGELIESTVLVGSAVSLTASTETNVTSISLTAGDWDVWGLLDLSLNGATTLTGMTGWIHTVSATFPTPPNGGAYSSRAATMTTGGAQHLPVGMRRLSLAATTTVYLSCYIVFGVNTCAAYGYLGARRVR